jgi:putative ABC transport system permease protein
MLRDFRFAIRALVKTPGYSAIAVLVLALGIGANTAIFSFVDAMLLRPLPYPAADRLFATVSIHRGRGYDRANVSYADYEEWRAARDLFDAVAVFRTGAGTITGGSGEPEQVQALSVSSDFFDLVGMRLTAGRGLNAADQEAAASAVTVISHAMWQRRFGADAGVIGKQLRIGGIPHTVVGVLEPFAGYPQDTDVYLPLVPSRFGAEDLSRRDNLMFEGIARLAATATRGEADARMRTIAARLEQEDPAARKGWTNGLVPLREYVVDPETTIALYVLLAAVGAVLLIACANLANLSLVRGAGRTREIGVRVALGAGRSQLIRQLVAESAVLGLAGGAAALAVAAAAVPALASMVPPGTPFIEQVGLDSRVLIASAAVTLLAVIAVGVLPAVGTSRVDVLTALKEGARGATLGRRTTMVRSGLVVAEIAIAVVLLVGAGLLLRSLDRVTRTPSGAEIDRVLAARIGVPGSRYAPAQRTEFFRRLIAQLAAHPGVQSAAITSYLPAGGGGFSLGRVFLSEGQPEPPASTDVPATWVVISEDYFKALGITLISGRAFSERDGARTTPVTIVSRSFAERMFPNQNPIGRRIRSWRDENVYREIVGVVSDVAFASLTDRSGAIVYVPHAQQGWGGMTIALRAASGSPDQLAPILRRVVHEMDAELALSDVGTMAVFARNSISRERLSALLMGALAVLALALAVLGVYGIMSYSVALRRQEMGVRLALGAAPRDLYRLVLSRGLALTLAGLAIGFIIAVPAGRAMQRLLYETSAFDPLAFGGMTAVLAVTALIACLLPARRAAAADPLAALRSE